MLINEKWDEVLQQKDVNKGFNIFLSTFLHKFETCFPMQDVINKTKNNQWTTAGITYLFIIIHFHGSEGMNAFKILE